MAHASSENLRGIADVLATIRGFAGVQETRPGIFYIRRRPFLHFHVRGDARWADAKIGTKWGLEIPLPFDAGAKMSSMRLQKSHKSHAVAKTGTVTKKPAMKRTLNQFLTRDCMITPIMPLRTARGTTNRHTDRYLIARSTHAQRDGAMNR